MRVEWLTSRLRRMLIKLCFQEQSDVLCVIERPESELGKGLFFLFGSPAEELDEYSCARRLLNELKYRLKEHGFEFSYTLARPQEKKTGFYKGKGGKNV